MLGTAQYLTKDTVHYANPLTLIGPALRIGMGDGRFTTGVLKEKCSQRSLNIRHGNLLELRISMNISFITP